MLYADLLAALYDPAPVPGHDPALVPGLDPALVPGHDPALVPEHGPALAPGQEQAQAPAGQTTAPAGPADGSPAPAPSSPFAGMLLPLVLCAAVFYLLVLGPERKQRKKRELMLKQIGKGDKVMTTGGLYATVAAVQDDVITLQIAEGVRARFSRSSVQNVLADDGAVAEKEKEASKK